MKASASTPSAPSDACASLDSQERGVKSTSTNVNLTLVSTPELASMTEDTLPVYVCQDTQVTDVRMKLMSVLQILVSMAAFVPTKLMHSAVPVLLDSRAQLALKILMIVAPTRVKMVAPVKILSTPTLANVHLASVVPTAKSTLMIARIVHASMAALALTASILSCANVPSATLASYVKILSMNVCLLPVCSVVHASICLENPRATTPTVIQVSPTKCGLNYTLKNLTASRAATSVSVHLEPLAPDAKPT